MTKSDYIELATLALFTASLWFACIAMLGGAA